MCSIWINWSAKQIVKIWWVKFICADIRKKNLQMCERKRKEMVFSFPKNPKYIFAYLNGWFVFFVAKQSQFSPPIVSKELEWKCVLT